MVTQHSFGSVTFQWNIVYRIVIFFKARTRSHVKYRDGNWMKKLTFYVKFYAEYCRFNSGIPYFRLSHCFCVFKKIIIKPQKRFASTFIGVFIVLIFFFWCIFHFKCPPRICCFSKMSDSESEENRIKYVDESKSYNYYFFYDQVNQGKIKDVYRKIFLRKKLITFKTYSRSLAYWKVENQWCLSISKYDTQSIA